MKDNEPTAGQEPRITDSDNHDKATGHDQEAQAEIVGGDSAPSQIDQLVSIAEGRCELFHDNAETPYARIGAGTVLRVEKEGFRRWLQREYRLTTKRAANPASVKAAVNELAATALWEGEERPVSLRVGKTPDGLALDLGRSDAQTVKVNGSGWEIGKPPIDFERKPQAGSLPLPSHGGSIEVLNDILNIETETDLMLIVGWCFMALKPTGPKPILILQGEPGSAKTTMTEALKYLIDPAVPLTRSLPRNERDLAVAAAGNWILAYDNVSFIHPDTSDSLCRLSTGGGLGTRKLYTDDEEAVFEHMRPLIINGLDAIATRQDLLSRAIVIQLPAIGRDVERAERDVFFRRLEEARPAILGALLDAAVVALAHSSEVSLSGLPRMADFATWVSAAEPAFGWEEGSFLKILKANESEALKTSLEGSLVASALQRALQVESEIAGTPTDLLARLAIYMSPDQLRSKQWPSSAQQLSRQVSLLSGALLEIGIEIEKGSIGRDKDKPKWWTITRVDGPAEASS